jgi:hypothetical protein
MGAGGAAAACKSAPSVRQPSTAALLVRKRIGAGINTCATGGLQPSCLALACKKGAGTNRPATLQHCKEGGQRPAAEQAPVRESVTEFWYTQYGSLD